MDREGWQSSMQSLQSSSSFAHVVVNNYKKEKHISLIRCLKHCFKILMLHAMSERQQKKLQTLPFPFCNGSICSDMFVGAVEQALVGWQSSHQTRDPHNDVYTKHKNIIKNWPLVIMHKLWSLYYFTSLE